MNKVNMKAKLGKLSTPMTALIVAAMAVNAGAVGSFDSASLTPVAATADSILAVGAGIAIAFVVYKVGKRASNKV